MRTSWLYLKLAVLLFAAVMMFGSLKSNKAFAEACTGGCANDCTLSVCCKCQSSTTCGCKIQSGEQGCGTCQKNDAELPD